MNKINKINKYKIVLFSVIIGTLLLFTGCDASVDGNRDGFSLGKDSSSSSGGGGVELSFSEGRPPSDFYKGEEVIFGFVFKNYQNHPIENLVIRASGFEKGYVSGLEDYADRYTITSIPAANSNTGKPGVYSMERDKQPRVTVDGFEHKYNFNPSFDYCYEAKTSFIEQICVKSKDKNICDVEYEEYKTQNGPLTVSIDRIESIEDKVTILFKVENDGDGMVVNEYFELEDYANEYKAKVTLGSQAGDCTTKSGKFEVMDGESIFYCNFDRTQDSAYSSQVVVELDYKYQQFFDKKIVVNDLQSSLE